MKTIEIKVKKLSNIEKFRGLIGKDNIEPVYFETRCGIHTFGVKYPLDLVILDRNNQVVATKVSLKQSSFFFWNPKYTKVIELPEGYINKLNISVGVKIKFY